MDEDKKILEGLLVLISIISVSIGAGCILGTGIGFITLALICIILAILIGVSKL